jgi:hypothetical protein
LTSYANVDLKTFWFRGCEEYYTANATVNAFMMKDVANAQGGYDYSRVRVPAADMVQDGNWMDPLCRAWHWMRPQAEWNALRTTAFPAAMVANINTDFVTKGRCNTPVTWIDLVGSHP